MPINLQYNIENLFFLFVPVFIIKLFLIEFDGYLSHYIPKTGDVVLDCGAWKGHFTLLASRLVGKKGLVYSFEPQKKMFEFIKERIKKYKIKNVIVINSGVYYGKMTITVENEEISDGFSIIGVKKDNIIFPVTISLTDIDSFVKDYNVKKVDYIKMDIEGAEIEAIQGAKETLKNNSVNIAIATYHIRDGKQSAIWVENFIRELGYKSWTGNPLHLTTYGVKHN